jgi:hypothetical protein
MTDERRWALIGQSSLGGRVPIHLATGLMHTASLTSVGLERSPSYFASDRAPVFGPYDSKGIDPFHAYAGDEPYYRTASANEAFARADAAIVRAGQRLRFGLGGAWDHVRLYELDTAKPQTPHVDSLRTYDAGGPMGFAYLQHRMDVAGLIVNDGLRLQVFDAGSQAPGSKTIVRISPRLGIAYPVSTRDAFSFAYARIEQDPPRDFLYDSRPIGYDRHPIGSPLVEPAEVVMWQAALKHILDPAWSAQVAVFTRDVSGEPGVSAAVLSDPNHTQLLEHASIDDAQSSGVEVDLTHTFTNGVMHWSWTSVHAWGRESDPDGLPFGVAFGPRPLPTGQHPLDWDYPNMVGTDGVVQLRNGFSISWNSHFATGRPWTPFAVNEGSDFPGLIETDQYINARRMHWSEVTNLEVRYVHPWLRGVTIRCAVKNLFDHRGDVLPTLDGYPNPSINSLYDEYSAYRTETGSGGGGYWNGDGATSRWFPVNDPRLAQPPREIRLGFSIGD